MMKMSPKLQKLFSSVYVFGKVEVFKCNSNVFSAVRQQRQSDFTSSMIQVKREKTYSEMITVVLCCFVLYSNAVSLYPIIRTKW